jgi:hypothetical protein
MLTHRRSVPLIALLTIGLLGGVVWTGDGAASSSAASEVALVGAGDISKCTNNNDEATAVLLDGIAGTVFTLGDNVYDSGTSTEFNSCYDPTWGRHKARTMPVSGNHEYETEGASGYYDYFNGVGQFTGPAGDRDKGYYSYDAGDWWHVVVLNSECAQVGGCNAGSPQETWLRADLAAHSSKNVIAMWHKPRFSSGPHGDEVLVQPLWQALYDYGAELVLSGHEHDYERFAPQTATGTLDNTSGIVEIVAGTGGASHYGFGTPKPNSLVRNGSTYGVLKLTLHETSYDWQFVPIAGQTFTDSGTASVHGAPGAPTVTPTPLPAVGGIAEAPQLTPSASGNAGPDARRVYGFGGVALALCVALVMGGWLLRRARSA